MDGRTDRKRPAVRVNIASLAVPGKQRNSNKDRYCIPCAVSHPGFRERAPLTHSAPFDEAQPRAWIEGRPYSLRHHPDPVIRCACCGGEASPVYYPEGPDAQAS